MSDSYFDRYQQIKLGLLPKESGKKEKVIIKDPSKAEQDAWFFRIEEKHWGGGLCYCMECGDLILRIHARHATAHLLAKKIFKSVATHELNYLILGASCGCHYKTDRIDKFVQMKMWPEAARRIKIIIPLLQQKELKGLSADLLTALDNTP